MIDHMFRVCASTAARLYGYLLLCAEPVSLDRITADLEISKSSASCRRTIAGSIYARPAPRRARNAPTFRLSGVAKCYV
ncbi:hypothetical protein N8E89_28155 (plasmid) [Phyllobacterium sp. A18/5-2]|uniref:hypothetical protein n=1 Tax=Phyllobacterium sp. A18/5-2 TaxID=2978392 RepID=UPI0021CAA55E|nr:hypothetical protein [Phyllobacterium sp. A18/5-2]UXN67726.1 hypothetical protein N8E89_28155 [Phyllobacterium sp. A18/5-2]